MTHGELLINGFFIGGPCDSSIGKEVIRSPWDGRVVGTVAEGGWGELRTAIGSAHNAFAEWRDSPRSRRQGLLRAVGALVRERAEELAWLMTDEIGKPITASRGEIARTAITFDAAADALDSSGMTEMPLGRDPRCVGFTAHLERFPIGVVLGIVPYNWPFNLAAHKIAPALAVGNTVVLKVSPLAPLSTLALARLIHEAGCPPGVLNAWHGPVPAAEKAIREDTRLRMLSFTGSAAVGWKLKALMPDRRVTLELGGDATTIVDCDANLDDALPRVVASAFGYAGQVCISTQHLLVHESILEDVRARLVQLTRHCPTGDPRDPATVCGPLIHADAADRVENWIVEAQSAGAIRLWGGVRTGNLITPTVLENVPADVRLASEEVFGPVLTLSSYRTLDEAFTQVNGSRYGIHAGIFTSNPAVADRAFRELEVGGVVINETPSLRFDTLPYGGVKQSGFGREGIPAAMDEMTECRTRVARWPSAD